MQRHVESHFAPFQTPKLVLSPIVIIIVLFLECDLTSIISLRQLTDGIDKQNLKIC